MTGGDALLARLDRLESEADIRRLVTRYMALCDQLDADTPINELGALFAEDAVWQGVGPRYASAFGAHTGRAAIMAMLGAYQTTPPHFAINAHFLCSEHIEVQGDGAVGGWMMLQTSTYHDGRSELRSARLTISFARIEGQWLISRFETENLFTRPVRCGTPKPRPPLQNPSAVEPDMTPQPAQPSMNYDALVQDDRVHTSLYTDGDIFDAEMDKIFKNTWVWVAHISELPGPSTFKTAHVGSTPVIVTRDRNDDVHVLLNRCRHRAASVCQHRAGKANLFVCSYHGWSYGLDGTLRGVTRPEGYSEDFDKADYPLVSLRVEQYGGMIFATFRRDIEPLCDFLGPAKTWIDLFMKQGAGFGVRVGGEHKFRFQGNWKIQLENTTDAYHFPIVHRTFLNSLDDETEELMDVLNQGGWVEDLGNGHSVMVMIPDLVDLEDNLEAPIPERFRELADELTAEGRTMQDVARIVRAVGGTGFNLNLFPNVACSMAFFRVLRPIAVDETEISHIALQMDGGPAAGNRMRLRLHEYFQGPMGFGSPDDAEGWERVQRGARAGDDLWVLVNRGNDPLPGRAPGSNARDVSSETGMRAAYQMWKRLMAA